MERIGEGGRPTVPTRPEQFEQIPLASPGNARGALTLVPSTVLESTMVSKNRRGNEGPGIKHAPACVTESVDRDGATVQVLILLCQPNPPQAEVNHTLAEETKSSKVRSKLRQRHTS